MNQLLRKLAAELVERGETSVHKFKIAAGVFFFPEGMCPYCESPIKSKFIWNLSPTRVLGQWKIIKNQLKTSPRISHPHINHGYICLGYSDDHTRLDAATALFLGMNLMGSYWGISDRKWFPYLIRAWGHDCPKDVRPITTARRFAAAQKLAEKEEAKLARGAVANSTRKSSSTSVRKSAGKLER